MRENIPPYIRYSKEENCRRSIFVIERRSVLFGVHSIILISLCCLTRTLNTQLPCAIIIFYFRWCHYSHIRTRLAQDYSLKKLFWNFILLHRVTVLATVNLLTSYSRASVCLAAERLDNNVWSAVEASRFAETEGPYTWSRLTGMGVLPGSVSIRSTPR